MQVIKIAVKLYSSDTRILVAILVTRNPISRTKQKIAMKILNSSTKEHLNNELDPCVSFKVKGEQEMQEKD